MTLTVIFSEKSSPAPPVSPWPLIYTCEFDHDFDIGDGSFEIAEVYQDEILQRVAEQRVADLDTDLSVNEVAKGLELHFAFEGNLEPNMDWREVG